MSWEALWSIRVQVRSRDVHRRLFVAQTVRRQNTTFDFKGSMVTDEWVQFNEYGLLTGSGLKKTMLDYHKSEEQHHRYAKCVLVSKTKVQSRVATVRSTRSGSPSSYAVVTNYGSPRGGANLPLGTHEDADASNDVAITFVRAYGQLNWGYTAVVDHCDDPPWSMNSAIDSTLSHGLWTASTSDSVLARDESTTKPPNRPSSNIDGWDAWGGAIGPNSYSVD